MLGPEACCPVQGQAKLKHFIVYWCKIKGLYRTLRIEQNLLFTYFLTNMICFFQGEVVVVEGARVSARNPTELHVTSMCGKVLENRLIKEEFLI